MGSLKRIEGKLSFFERWAERRKKAARKKECAEYRYLLCKASLELRKRGHTIEANALGKVLRDDYARQQLES